MGWDEAGHSCSAPKAAETDGSSCFPFPAKETLVEDLALRAGQHQLGGWIDGSILLFA